MSPVHLLLSISLLACGLWMGRRIPLAGVRKPLSIGCRVLALGALCLALWGSPARRTLELPRRLVYLVDRSASLDASQRAWVIRRIASLESLRPPHLERAIIAFGAEARVVVPFGREPLTDPGAIQRVLEGALVQGDHTNLELALLSTIGLLPLQPPGHVGLGQAPPATGTSVVVLSDGRETIGDVAGILPAARRFGLELFPAPPPMFGERKTVWEALAVPPVVQRGSSVPIQLVVFNAASRPKPGQVTVGLHGVPLKRQRITVRPGWQVLTVTAPAIQRGTMALDVRVEIPTDRIAEHRRAYTEVEGPPQVLLVSDRTTVLPVLATALKRREIDVATGQPADVASDVSRLLDYDAVVLFNLPKSSLSAAQVEALRTYVERLGGGLVMVGLGGDLAHEVSTPSPLDPLLPVIFEPKGLQESKRRVCMIMLIDRSQSMRSGRKSIAAKRAAVELTKQLLPEDLVGIFAFDVIPRVVAEVQPAGQVGPSLIEKLVMFKAGGGTLIYLALAVAADRLILTGASVKHILLISDGEGNEFVEGEDGVPRLITPYPQRYEELIQVMKAHQIFVSVFAVKAGVTGRDFGKWLAKATGGRFYAVSNEDTLPELVARDVHGALGELPFTEGYFPVSRSHGSEWFIESDRWPSLRGFLTATAKPGAQVDLTVNGGSGDEPLLARWMVGQGRVVSFTSDADARWSPEWIRWPGFDATWAQVVRWAMRPRVTESLFAWVDEGRAIPQLVIEGELSDPRGELVLPAGRHGSGAGDDAIPPPGADAGGGTIPLSLVQTGTWRWQASLEQIPSGWYQLVLESKPPAETAAQAGPTGASNVTPVGPAGTDQARGTIVAKRWLQVGAPPTSQEIVGQPPNETLLRQLARATDGVYDTPDRAFLPPTTTATTMTPLFIWWLPVVIVLVLIDIALRGSSML